MLVVEIDAVDAEPPEAALARRPHVRRVAVDLLLAVDVQDAELGGQELHLVPDNPAAGAGGGLQLQRLAQEELVGVSEVSRKVTPAATAWWMSLTMSGSGLGGPYAKDMPMQPRPSAETSSPCDPSFMRGTTTRDDTTAAAAAMAIDRDGMVLLLLSLLLQNVQ